MPRRTRRASPATALHTLTPPDVLPSGQQIARVVAPAGNNLYRVRFAASPSAESYGPAPQDDPAASVPEASGPEEEGEALVEMPPRFRSRVWVKRGSYVVVDVGGMAERGKGGKIAGEIANVVRDLKGWRGMGYWPKEFMADGKEVGGNEEEDEDDEQPNVGRMPPSESEEEDEGEEGEEAAEREKRPL